MYSNKLQTKQQKKKISKSKDLFYMGILEARIQQFPLTHR